MIRSVVRAASRRPISTGRGASAFGDDLKVVRKAMHQLARALTPKKLAGTAFNLYEKFRPKIAMGKRGRGQKGTLDLELIRSLADEGRDNTRSLP